MKPPEKTAYLTVRVPDEQRRALERAARREDRTVSAIVRIAVAEWLRVHQQERRAS